MININNDKICIIAAIVHDQNFIHMKCTSTEKQDSESQIPQSSSISYTATFDIPYCVPLTFTWILFIEFLYSNLLL